MDSLVHQAATGGRECPYASPPGMELADFASESVIVSDEHGVIQYWNAASEALYGWPAMAMIGRSFAAFCALGQYDAEQHRTLRREGRWDGVVRRRNLAGTEVAAAVRQIVRRDATGALLDIVEFGRNAGTISQATTVRIDAELQGYLAACWELDTSSARPLLDTIAELRSRGTIIDLDQHPQWVEKLLTATRISAVNDRAVRMFGAHAGLEQMIGKPVSAFWPAESRSVLATLLESVSADRSRLETRNMVLSGTIRNPTIRAWHSAEPKPPGTVFVTINGAADDDRTSWELQASEQRYRKLIEYLPTALWQVDSRRAGEAFDLLKANGIRDIAAYLDQNLTLLSTPRMSCASRKSIWMRCRCFVAATPQISYSPFDIFLRPPLGSQSGSWLLTSKADGISSKKPGSSPSMAQSSMSCSRTHVRCCPSIRIRPSSPCRTSAND